MKLICCVIFGFAFLSTSGPMMGRVQQINHPFTVADEIGLRLFGDPSGRPPALHFSPNGHYFAVWTERGRLDLNRVEDSLRFYRSQDVENFLKHSNLSKPPSPVWVVTRATYREGPIINDWRWLADSSGVAYLERIAGDNQRLVLADLQRKALEPLTSARETVRKFDIRNRRQYVYTALDLAQDTPLPTRQAPMIVGTGRSLEELLFSNNVQSAIWSSPYGKLHAIIRGKRFQVIHDGTPLLPSSFADLALSPDGGSLVTMLPVTEVPSSWETLYPPPFPSSPFRIHGGHRDRQSGDAVDQYVRIDLQSGSVQALTDAPFRWAAGWSGAGGGPSWSSDGKAILLPDTFVSNKDHTPSRPCLAVVDLSSNSHTCVEEFSAPTEIGFQEGSAATVGARFIGGDKHRVEAISLKHGDLSFGTTEYRYAADGSWQVIGKNKGMREAGYGGFEITVKEGLNDPPLLVASDKQTSRVIWDPNPQLRSIELGDASVYTWNDKKGHGWKGGLYKPINYEPGHRYPLVIQTHGFRESEFKPSGFFPTALAARALVADGIVVLQVDDLGCMSQSSHERTCAISGYESAVNQLVSEGLVNPDKVGIIGFSRTCFYVMETLTTASLHLTAASITDGVMYNYLQYLVNGGPGSTLASEANAIIGAPPFGEGLQQWLNQSPGFNLDKVVTPLLVVGEGPASVLFMWEPYAVLRYLQKPVDLIMLNTDEHVLTNPAVRMASQGGSVDWFRFWLQDYEDPDPAKVEEYKRWRELRKIQHEKGNKFATPQAASE
jgi:hypothetical protein